MHISARISSNFSRTHRRRKHQRAQRDDYLAHAWRVDGSATPQIHSLIPAPTAAICRTFTPFLLMREGRSILPALSFSQVGWNARTQGIRADECPPPPPTQHPPWILSKASLMRQKPYPVYRRRTDKVQNATKFTHQRINRHAPHREPHYPSSKTCLSTPRAWAVPAGSLGLLGSERQPAQYILAQP